MWQGPCLHGWWVSKNAFVNGIATVWDPVLSKHALWPVETPVFWHGHSNPGWKWQLLYCAIIFQLFVYVKWSSQFWVPHEWNSEHFHWSGVITSDFSRTATESCESQNVKRWHRCNMRHVGTWFGSESQPSSARFQGLACCTTENARKNSMQLACHESSAEGSAGVQLSNPRRSRPLDLWFPWLQRVLTVVLMILTAQVVQHENNPTSQSGSTVGRS